MIGMRAATAPFFDLGRHGARHHVAAGQVFRGRRIARHETLAVLVHQIAALAAHPFGDQHARAVHAGRMELEELHVFQRYAGACRHAESVAGVDVGIGAGREDAPRAAGGEQRGARLQDHHFGSLDLHRHHAQHVAVLVADQIERHPLHEEVGVGLDVLLIQGVQQRMTGAVGCGTGARHRVLAVILHVAAERTLVDLAAVQPIERHAVMLQLVHHFRCGAAHVFDGILIAEIVRTLHRVVHMPVPVVFVDVAQRSGDAALSRHGMRTCGEHLGQHRDFQARLGQRQCGAHPRTARAHHHHIECSFCYCHYSPHKICTDQITYSTSASMTNTWIVRRILAGFT